MKFKCLMIAATILGCFIAFSSSVSAKTLVYCSEASPEGFDPALYLSGTTIDAAALTVFDRLIEFDSEKSGVLIPGLAEKWLVSDDGLEYTFYLRHGVKFQTTDYFTPTRNFNADDVIFTFDRAKNPNNPWFNYIAGTTYQYFDNLNFSTLIKDVIKQDDYTVKIVLNRAEAPFLANLAMAFMSINSKEYADQLNKNNTKQQFNIKPVGTGPFVFVKGLA